MLFSCFATEMVLYDPFVHWVYYPTDPDEPRTGGVYELNTGNNSSEIVGVAINEGGDHLYYRALPAFVQEYSAILPLGNIMRWDLKKHFVAWMESIIYHSFLRYSVEGMCFLLFESYLKI